MHSRFARCISKPRTSLEKGGVVCLDTVSDLPSCPQVKFFPSESSWGGAGWNSLCQKIVLSLLLPWVNREGLRYFNSLLPFLWHPVCLWGWCVPSAVLTRVGNLSPFLPASYFFSLLGWPLGLNMMPVLSQVSFFAALTPRCVLTRLLSFPNVSMWHSWGAEGWGGGPCSQPSPPAPCRYNNFISGQSSWLRAGMIPLLKALLRLPADSSGEQ